MFFVYYLSGYLKALSHILLINYLTNLKSVDKLQYLGNNYIISKNGAFCHMEQYELIRILKENTYKSARKLSEEFGNSLHFWSVSRKYQEALNNRDYQFFHKIESAKRDNVDIEGFGSNQSNILKQVHYSIFGGINDVLRNEPILTREQAEELETHLNNKENAIKNLIEEIRILEMEIEDLKDENRDNSQKFKEELLECQNEAKSKNKEILRKLHEIKEERDALYITAKEGIEKSPYLEGIKRQMEIDMKKIYEADYKWKLRYHIGQLPTQCRDILIIGMVISMFIPFLVGWIYNWMSS